MAAPYRASSIGGNGNRTAACLRHPTTPPAIPGIMTTGVLFRITKYGTAALVGSGYQSDMAGYETVLTDDEIVSVLSFIKSRWPANIRKPHDQLNASRR